MDNRYRVVDRIRDQRKFSCVDSDTWALANSARWEAAEIVSRNHSDIEAQHAIKLLVFALAHGDVDAAWDLAMLESRWPPASCVVRLRLIFWAAAAGSSDAALWAQQSPEISGKAEEAFGQLYSEYLESRTSEPCLPPYSLFIAVVNTVGGF
jgi:hypothetical protein